MSGKGIKKKYSWMISKSICFAILLTEASWLFPGNMADTISESYEMQHALWQKTTSKRQKPTSKSMAELMMEWKCSEIEIPIYACTQLSSSVHRHTGEQNSPRNQGDQEDCRSPQTVSPLSAFLDKGCFSLIAPNFIVVTHRLSCTNFWKSLSNLVPSTFIFTTL